MRIPASETFSGLSIGSCLDRLDLYLPAQWQTTCRAAHDCPQRVDPTLQEVKQYYSA